jgi:hypothetical protein
MALKEYQKVTIGFVIQTYKEVNGESICTEQEFIAGDQVEFEPIGGGEKYDSTEVDNSNYQPFHMVQPSTKNQE